MQINDDLDTKNFQIGVVGGGSWGTALANLLASKGYPINLWVYEKEVKDHILQTLENKIFLPEVKLPAKDLADRLTMAGLEVTSLEQKDHDWIFEIEITPNRPDLLSVEGIAREVAAITESKIKRQKPKIKRLKAKSGFRFRIKVANKKDCPLYTAKAIKNIRVAPSPAWLQKRLELVELSRFEKREGVMRHSAEAAYTDVLDVVTSFRS